MLTTRVIDYRLNSIALEPHSRPPHIYIYTTPHGFLKKLSSRRRKNGKRFIVTAAATARAEVMHERAREIKLPKKTAESCSAIHKVEIIIRNTRHTHIALRESWLCTMQAHGVTRSRLQYIHTRIAPRRIIYIYTYIYTLTILFKFKQ